MRVALVNWFHAGDVIMCRPLIRRVRPLLIDIVALELRCHPKYLYLWEDMGLPTSSVTEPEPGVNFIDMWFGHGGDLLGVTGLTHVTHVTSYNRQATRLGLPTIDPSGEVPEIDFPPISVQDPPGVLVENGPVLSGQQMFEMNSILVSLAKSFPRTRFYCTAKPPPGTHNLIDVSGRNLIEVSALSNVCVAMVSRLSGPFISTLTKHNRGRLPRFVYGKPIGCPIWDESDVRYCNDFKHLQELLRGVIG